MSFNSIFIIIGLVTIIGFYYLYWRPKSLMRWYQARAKEKGYKVKVLPFHFLGFHHIHQFINDQKKYKDCNRSFKEFSSYDIVISNILTKVHIDIVNTDLKKEFYNPNNLPNLPKTQFIKNNLVRALGRGIIFSQGNQWKNKRKIINTVFNFDFLKSSIPKIIETCDRQFKYYERQSLKNNPIDGQKGQFQIEILDVFAGIFSNVMLQCFFGSQLQGKGIDGSRISKFLGQLLFDVRKQAIEPHTLIFGTKILNWGIFQNDRKINKKVIAFRKLAQQVIENRIAEIKVQNKRNQKYSDIVEALVYIKAMDKQKDVQNSQVYDYQQLINQFCTFYTAGTDTTSHLTTMMIYYLALYPQFEQKLRQQVNTHIKSDQDLKNYDILKKMKFLQALQNETLRCYGPAHTIFMRKSKEDMIISNLPIKKDTMLSLSLIGNQYDPKNFKDPFVFNPNRWLQQNEQINLHPFAFTPFSAGPRTCIGKQLALLQNKIAIIRFIQRYKQFVIPKKDFAIQMKFLPGPQSFKTKLFIS